MFTENDVKKITKIANIVKIALENGEKRVFGEKSKLQIAVSQRKMHIFRLIKKENVDFDLYF